MTTQHTPEPWMQDDTVIVVNSRVIASVRDLAVESQLPEDRANARRIVACVNACAGIGTESLELANGKHRVIAYLESERQRDELAEALRSIERLEETSTDGADFESIVVNTQTIARAALAKLP